MAPWIFPAPLAALALLAAALPAAAGPPEPCPPQDCLASEVSALRTVEAARRDGVQILDQVSRALPELLWLDKLTYRQGKLLLEGKAYTTNAIAQLVEALSAIEGFSSAQLMDTTETADHIYQFKTSSERLPGPKPGPGAAQGTDEKKLREERAELLRGIRRRAEVPATLDTLRHTLEEAGLPIKSFRPDDLSTLTRIDALAVRIHLGSTTYHDLARLFDRLSRFPTFVFLHELVLWSDPGGPGTLQAAFTLKVPTLDAS